MNRLVRSLLFPFVQLYWKIFQPKTYGVKIIVQHPLANKILIVRHSYGDRSIWHLPGGGYRPNRESAKSAAKREIKEELGLELTNLKILGEYKTTAEGKRDTTTIFWSRAQSAEITPNSEIAEYLWITPHNFANIKPVYKISKYAMQLLKQKEVD